MQFDKISIYGSAGGIENKAEITAHIRASDCDKLSNAEALIAAAPELLAALKAMIEYDTGTPDDVLNQARAAIAKAEGK